jgi:hypothetical protein
VFAGRTHEVYVGWILFDIGKIVSGWRSISNRKTVKILREVIYGSQISAVPSSSAVLKG